ncbi:MAG: hypothetical protein IKU33_00940 [Bacteroidales bacterium]|nr:hypothetical protein [Bacteroidales bacterium]
MCEWCSNEKIKDAVILKSAVTHPEIFGKMIYIDLMMCRKDRWEAELAAWVAVGDDRRGIREPISVTKEINFCPFCGRRLALADASRRETHETD